MEKERRRRKKNKRERCFQQYGRMDGWTKTSVNDNSEGDECNGGIARYTGVSEREGTLNGASDELCLFEAERPQMIRAQILYKRLR